jgi:hypothetical protein
MVLLYDAGTQVRQVRFLMVVSILTLFSPILILADGKEVELAIMMGVIGLVFWLIMYLYGKIYVSGLWLVRDRDLLCIETVNLFSRTRRFVPLVDCDESTYYKVRMSQAGAIWVPLRIRGKRVPFIVDALGTVHDRRGVRSILRMMRRRLIAERTAMRPVPIE